jgi:hypothetical protein
VDEMVSCTVTIDTEHGLEGRRTLIEYGQMMVCRHVLV